MLSMPLITSWYILEEDTTGTTRGRCPIHLDAGAPAGSALRHSRRAIGHKLRVLFIDYLMKHVHKQI